MLLMFKSSFVKINAKGSKALEEIKLRLAVRKTRSQMAIYSLITAGKKQEHEKEQGKEGARRERSKGEM